MTLWFSATSVTPALSRELHLSATEASWLTMAVQGGFVVGTLLAAFINIADLVEGRHLVCAGAVGGASPTWRCSPHRRVARDWTALSHRPRPGRRLSAGDEDGRELVRLPAWPGAGAADWCTHARQGRAAPDDDGLRRSLAAAAAGGVRAVTDRRRARPASPPATAYLSPSRRFDPHAIRRLLGIRGVRLAIAGYLGHMWGCAMWTWVGVFATASFAAAGLGPAASTAGSAAAFLAIGSGAAGCALAGYAADRMGKAGRGLGAGDERHLRASPRASSAHARCGSSRS